MEVVRCPKCNGTGKEMILSDERGDYECQCYTCKGKGIVIEYINPITNKVEYKNL